MKLPIDTAALNCTCSLPPEPVMDFTSKQQKADANGEPLYSVELVCIGDGGGEVMTVKFPGTPPAGIRQGEAVRVTGLMVTDYAIDNRYGLTFRAAKVEPLSVGGQKASAA